MRGNPGTIIILPDGRKAIVYNKQPLLREKRKVVITLIDERYCPIIEGGRAKTLLKDVGVYNAEIKNYKVIGMID